MSPDSIILTNVIKEYTIQARSNYGSLREDLAALLSFQKSKGKVCKAVNNVSFSIPRGQIVGLIGHNGAGKSTILKLISSITSPTSGNVHVSGRVSTLMELGAGFHYELTGRENIAFFGAILGMSREEVKDCEGNIIAFADIGDYLDVPMKRYSSGMQLRLGFAIASHVNTDILLLDEILAVGDEAFRKKCLKRMEEILSRNITIVITSHHEETIRSVAQRVLVMHWGCLIHDGKIDEGFEKYRESLNAPVPRKG